MDQGVALATIFTAAGAPIWGGIIQAVIQVLKAVPQFAGLIEGREKLLCFIFAGIFVALAFWAGTTATPPSNTLDILGIVAAILCWFTVARIAMALYDDLLSKNVIQKESPAGERPPQSVLSATGWTGK